MATWTSLLLPFKAKPNDLRRDFSPNRPQTGPLNCKNVSPLKHYYQSSRKRLIGRVFTQTFAVLRQINPDMDSPLRLFFIVTTVNKMTTEQYSE